jgi:hypothetical protein
VWGYGYDTEKNLLPPLVREAADMFKRAHTEGTLIRQ